MKSISARSTVKSAIATSKKSLTFQRLNSTLVSFRDEPEVTVTNLGSTVRVINLNRPEKLNALDANMTSKIAKTIVEYNKSTSTDCILLKSSHNTANSTNSKPIFCSGADIVQVVKDTFKNDEQKIIDFFTNEYSLGSLISQSQRPVIVIMDGLTYGGGVGLSTFSPLRIATENTKWGMPEMNIGFFPDFGVSYTLPKQATVGGSQGQLGLYLCLTGDELNGADAYIAGFATHYINSQNLKDLEIRLSELNNIGNFRELAARNKEIFKTLRKINRKQLNNKTETEQFWKNQVTEIENIMGFKDFATTIEEFSSSLPDSYKFKYTLDELNIIEKFFKVNASTSLTKIIENLKAAVESKSQYNEAEINFITKTLNVLEQKSKISLEIAVEQFKRNSTAPTPNAALKQDLVTAINMALEPSTNEFAEIVDHKFIKKLRDQPFKSTKKDTLSNESLHKIYSESPLRQVELQKFTLNAFEGLESLKPTIENYGLPTEEDVHNYIIGNDKTNRSVAPTTTNIISYFTKHAQGSGKIGTSYLLKNIIIPRKCKVDDFTKTVEWKSV